MQCIFLFVEGHLHGIGTTVNAAIRDAERNTPVESQPFDPRHPSVSLECATYGAYLAAKAAHNGTVGRAVWSKAANVWRLPRR